MATLELKAKGESEIIYLPSSDIEIEKALMRLGVQYLKDCEICIDSHEIPDRILEMIPEKQDQVERIVSMPKWQNIIVILIHKILYREIKIRLNIS